MSNSSESRPPFSTPLSSAGQQFVSASVALVTAVENVGAQVRQLDAARSEAASDIVGVREHVAAVEQRVVAIETKSQDNTKWAQLALSVLAFVVSLVSVGYSIKFGIEGAALSTRTEALEKKIGDVAAQETILTLITSMVDLEPQTHSPAGQVNPGSLSASVRFKAEANKVEIYRADYGFTHIEAKMFASLMRTVLSFPDVEHAKSYWSSVDSVKIGGLNDSLEIAIVDADFARMIENKEELEKAALRLNGCLKDPTIEPDQQIDVHLALSQMYAGIVPIVGKNIENARRELKFASDVLSAARTNQADFGKDVDARVTLINGLINTSQTKLDAAEEKRRARDKQEMQQPTQSPVPASTKPAVN
jgi:hypothetical protein